MFAPRETALPSSLLIKYVSDTKWGAKIVPGATQAFSCWQNSGNYVEINGFDIGGNGTSGSAHCNNIINSWGGSHVRIIGNNVHDPFGDCTNGGGGIVMGYADTTTALNGLIDSNVAHDIGNNALYLSCPNANNRGHGIYPSRPYIMITNNITYYAQGFGIHAYHNCDHCVIANNLSFNNGSAGILFGWDYVATMPDHITVVNNISRDNTGRCITGYGFSGTTHNFISNNVCFNNSATYSLSGTDVALSQVNVDPRQVTFNVSPVSPTVSGGVINFANADYHLTPGSPAKDRGTTACASGITNCVPTRDIDGTPRPQGFAIDIGAYEQ